MMICPCGTKRNYDACCAPFHKGEALPQTAEKLMRSRYSAFVKAEITYLKDTYWPKFQRDFDEASYRARAINSTWLGLEIEATDGGESAETTGTVTFVATSMTQGSINKQREKSLFKKKAGRWYYVEQID
ncbi:MAG: YchJ family metal-binding protein [Hyphomicrobiales bacterium]